MLTALLDLCLYKSSDPLNRHAASCRSSFRDLSCCFYLCTEDVLSFCFAALNAWHLVVLLMQIGLVLFVYFDAQVDTINADNSLLRACCGKLLEIA